MKVSSNLYVANLMGQHSYGREGTHTNYEGLTKCLQELYSFNLIKGMQVYIPYLIGCGLAGGDWSIVSNLINTHCPNAIICKFVKDKQVEMVVEEGAIRREETTDVRSVSVTFLPTAPHLPGVIGKSDKPWLR